LTGALTSAATNDRTTNERITAVVEFLLIVRVENMGLPYLGWLVEIERDYRERRNTTSDCSITIKFN
jgi:hypothetical protein